MEADTKTKMPLRIITLNIRYAIKKTLVPNEHPWEVRCPKIAAQLRILTAGQTNAFICVQEAQYQQLLNLQEELGPRWSKVGRGRADGKNDGEFSPIFYRSDHWNLEQTKTYWLSPTPEIPSNGWGASINRIATVGRFQHVTSATRVVVMSTHLDHSSRQARSESSRLLLEFARQWQQDSPGGNGAPTPVFLGGDFNSEPDDEPHRLLTDEGKGMTNIKDLVPESRHYGNRITYSTFGEAEPTTIDHLLVLGVDDIDFLNFAVMSNLFDDGVYYSDHRPVLADIEVPVLQKPRE